MSEINISTGLKRLKVSVDGVNGREVSFNPNDTLFMERLHRFYQVATKKAREWEQRQPEIERELAEVPTDENNMPETLAPAIKPIEEVNQFMREQIDILFGEGTAQAIFGEAVYRNPAVYVQLIDGIKSYIEPVRAAKIQQYIAQKKTSKPRKRTK